MKSAIKFLEELGKNADLRLDRVDFESLLNNDDFDPEIKEAILSKNQQSLEMLLNARTKIVCLLVPAEDDEGGDDQGDDNSQEIHSIKLSQAS